MCSNRIKIHYKKEILFLKSSLIGPKAGKNKLSLKKDTKLEITIETTQRCL